jgi:mRNA interferase HigB
MFAPCEHGQPVHVITRKALVRFWAKHLDAETPLKVWFGVTKRAHWKHITDVRKVFPYADAEGPYTVFNIGGNKYRLITTIDYSTGKVFIRWVFTHSEYDRWKE